MYKEKRYVGLFYFTGTGSSYQIALLLEAALKARKFSVEIFKIEKVLNGQVVVDSTKYTMLGIVAPIYGGSTPRPVREFVEKLPRNRLKVFIVRTAASNRWMNQSASVWLIHQLRKKWYDVVYDRILIVSSNCLLDMEDALTKKLYEVAKDKKVPHIVEQLEKGVRRRSRRNFLRDILVAVSHFIEEQVVARFFGKSLKANSDCTQCGLCEASCPMDNISFETGKFKAGWQCVLCMKCVYACPEKAIHSRGLDIVQFKNGYNYKWIIQNRRRKQKIHMSKHLWQYTKDVHR